MCKNISGALCCVQNTSLVTGETQDQGRNDDSVSTAHCQYLGQTVYILLMKAKLELASFSMQSIYCSLETVPYIIMFEQSLTKWHTSV